MTQMKLILVLSFLLILTFATKSDAAGTVVCNTVHAHENGETCISTAEKFKLTTEAFLDINPNIDCDTIFIGQWVCVDGTASP